MGCHKSQPLSFSTKHSLKSLFLVPRTYFSQFSAENGNLLNSMKPKPKPSWPVAANCLKSLYWKSQGLIHSSPLKCTYSINSTKTAKLNSVWNISSKSLHDHKRLKTYFCSCISHTSEAAFNAEFGICPLPIPIGSSQSKIQSTEHIKISIYTDVSKQ